MNKDFGDDCYYVRATCNYQYPHKGKEVSMVKDEVFMLIKKTTDEWWQVIRSGEKKTFFAPRKYLEITDVSLDTMKSSLKKKIAHQRHLQTQQRLYEESLKQQRMHDNTVPVMENLPEIHSEVSCKASDIVTNRKHYVSPEHSKTRLTASDTLPQNQNLGNRKDECSRIQNIHFEKEVIDPPDEFLDANKNEPFRDPQFKISGKHVYGDSFSATAHTKEMLPDDFSSGRLDSHLNESVESFSEMSESFKSSSFTEKSSVCSTPDKQVLCSELESVSTHTSKSSLNDASRSSIESFSQIKMRSHVVGKAASFDVLQSDEEEISPLKVSHQKAASTEELDHRNRRKEYLFQSDRLSLNNRSSSVDLKRFDNNLDLSECEKLTSLEKSRKCRITRDPMNRRRSWALNDCHTLNSFYKGRPIEQDVSAILDSPPKLPPKLKKSSQSLLSSSMDNLQKIEPPIDIKVEEAKQKMEYSQRPSHLTSSSTTASSNIHSSQSNSQESLDRKRTTEYSQRPSHITSSSISPSTTSYSHIHQSQPTSLDRKNKNQPLALPRKVIPADTEKEGKIISPENLNVGGARAAGWKKIQSTVLLREWNDEKRDNLNGRDDADGVKEKRVEELIERLESKTKSVDTSFKGRTQIQNPPTPTDPPRRLVFDDWGEYLDRESGRPFYYNSRTSEKRWKPPRKSICSTLGTDSPPSVPKENKALNTSSSKSIKVSSPVLPPTSNLPLWPSRERSFTTTAACYGSGAKAHHLAVETLSLSSPKNSLTLPPHSTVDDADTPSQQGSQTLPPPSLSPKEPSPTTKSHKSFFSTISNSLSFMKYSGGGSHNTNTQSSSSHTPPQVPPSNTKPQFGGALLGASGGASHSCESLSEEPEQVTLQSALERFHVPKGWIRKYDALSHQVYFESLVTGEKWNPAIDKTGTVYVYSATGGDSKWNLQQYEDLSPTSPHSPIERIKADALREDSVVWRLNMKEGKKGKKSWVTSFARYYPDFKKNIYGKSYGTIIFSKKLNDSKKVDNFDLVPPCFIDFHLKKQNSLCLRNGLNTEIVLQADSPAVATEWTKLLIEYDKVQEKNLASDKDKKPTKAPEKGQGKKDSIEDGDATKGIKDSLMLFFKRRMQQETLAKKGIYKDTVFGSTIGDLCQKEQLNTPMFVLQCIRNIEKSKENFLMDGLYRISGNASKIQKIRIEIAQNRYAILEEEKDVHNLTGSLKLFFRELKEPLIPFANYYSFIQATDIMKSKPRIEALRQAVKKLPLCNRDTLKILLDHLLKVNEHEQVNRMSVMNLAIVFGPCLLWPETTSGFDLMTDAMLHNRVVEALLSDFEEIFRKR